MKISVPNILQVRAVLRGVFIVLFSILAVLVAIAVWPVSGFVLCIAAILGALGLAVWSFDKDEEEKYKKELKSKENLHANKRYSR